MARAEVSLVRSRAGANYVATWTVTDTDDLPLALFVLVSGTAQYVRVAQLADMDLPTSTTPLLSSMYRSATATVTMGSYGEAQEHEADVAASLQELVEATEAGSDTWTGTRVYEVES